MTEQIKDYERLDREKWEEAALICPVRIKRHCGLLVEVKGWVSCEFASCVGRFFACLFGQSR